MLPAKDGTENKNWGDFCVELFFVFGVLAEPCFADDKLVDFGLLWRYGANLSLFYTPTKLQML